MYRYDAGCGHSIGVVPFVREPWRRRGARCLAVRGTHMGWRDQGVGCAHLAQGKASRGGDGMGRGS